MEQYKYLRRMNLLVIGCLVAINLRVRWCDTFLNEHARTEDTRDDTKYTLHHELENVLENFLGLHSLMYYIRTQICKYFMFISCTIYCHN